MQRNSIPIKILSAATPAVLVIPIALGLAVVLGTLAPPIRIIVYPILGTLGAALLYRLTAYISVRVGLGKPFWGSAKGAVVGIAIGLLVSFSSAGLYRAAFGGPLSLEPLVFFDKLGIRAWSNLGPSILEEVGFRGGLVFFANSFWGLALALVTGSFTFGLAHLASGLLGQPISIMHVLGTTMAGLLLTAIYLRYGLLSCIACHWVWNTLLGSWTRVLQIQGKGAGETIEGAWTTIVVLTIVSSALLLRLAPEIAKSMRQKRDVKT